MKKERVGKIFVKAGLLTEEDLEGVLEENRKAPEEKLGETLVRLNFASDTEVARVLSFQLEIPYIDLNTVVVDPYAIRRIPLKLAIQKHILPVYLEKNGLILAMDDPQDFEAIEMASFSSSLNIRPHVAAKSDIVAAIRRYYSIEDSLKAIMQNITPKEKSELIVEEKLSAEEIQELKKESESPVIEKLVNTIIFQGSALRASAIHLKPEDREVVVRNQVDGVFVESMRTPQWTQGALTSRLKMMAALDIAERHILQKGKATLKMQQSVIKFWISCIPTPLGEEIIIQFLDTDKSSLSIKNLRLPPDNLHEIKELLQLPQGLILVVGPSGHGKTTTLYTLIDELTRKQAKIITLEKSIEYQLPGIHQVQITEETGLTYARALSSALRHRPDVILVGEIRDKETAALAMKAILAGCLVLSALPTSGVIATISMLKELGVDPQLLASALAGIISQRLVRKICPGCRRKYAPPPKILQNIESRVKRDVSFPLSHGRGCATCHQTGYKERIGIYHLLMMSRGLREFIAQGAPEGKMRTAIDQREMESLMEDMLEKIKQGMTTLEELERVLPVAEKFDGAWGLQCPQCQQPVKPEWLTCAACGHLLKMSAATEGEQIDTLSQIARPKASKEDRYEFKRFKILLIDDEEAILQRVEFFLGEKGFVVTTANNGKEALEQIARDKPHLVLTDITMPEMNGLELIRRLRKDITTAFIPVIILSQKNEVADRLKGFAVGTDDYLPKPFSFQEVFFRINVILKRVYNQLGQ